VMLSAGNSGRLQRLAPRYSLAESTIVAADWFDVVERSGRSTRSAEARRRHRGVREVILWPRAGAPFGRLRVHPNIVGFIRAISAPARLSDVVSAPLDPRLELAVAKLILDGVVKVKVGSDFLSGAAAFDHLYDFPPVSEPVGPAERLSVRAAEYGEQLLPRSAADLAAKLYRYNSIPAGPRWTSRLPTFDATRDYLGIDGPAIARAARSHGWTFSISPTEQFHWFGWTPRVHDARSPTQDAPRATQKPRPIYKLYISVRAEHARAALEAVAPELFSSPAIALKIGAGVHGVLRPDKMVAYFWSRAKLAETAARLQPLVAGLPAHGVPFTASIGADGVLSWGIDPPVVSSDDAVVRRHSWRSRVAGRLAAALISAGAPGRSGLSASRFALARLRLDGIDLLDPDPVSALGALTPMRASRS